MRGVTMWRKLLGVEQLQVLDASWEQAAGQQVLVVSVRPSKGAWDCPQSTGSSGRDCGPVDCLKLDQG